MTVQSLPLQDVADKCHKHTILFYRGEEYDPQWCYELLRRALKLEDDDAFAHVYDVYVPQIVRWVRHHPKFGSTGQDPEDFVHDALAKFWHNLRGDKFDKFPQITRIMQYLKLCVHSAIWDYLKKYRPDLLVYNLDLTRLIGNLRSLEQNIHTFTILDCVEKALDDPVLMEQFELLAIYDMKPSEIVKQFAGWKNAQQISRLRQRIKYRLDNSKSLRTCLQGYLPPEIQ